MHSVTDRPTDGRTDRRTDRLTDRVTYWVAGTRLKTVDYAHAKSLPNIYFPYNLSAHLRLSAFVHLNQMMTLCLRFLHLVLSKQYTGAIIERVRIEKNYRFFNKKNLDFLLKRNTLNDKPSLPSRFLRHAKISLLSSKAIFYSFLL